MNVDKEKGMIPGINRQHNKEKGKIKMKRPEDFVISQGGYYKSMFVVSAEGNLWRRRNDPVDAGDFACHGAVVNPTDERIAELLRRLRNARPERGRQSYATVKQTRDILMAFNAEDAE